tara:strand:+ start:2123 stop:2884 length:762 start_codon:yes stop_codon:yes gene_type:complete
MVLPNYLRCALVLHSPASLIPGRYKFISDNIDRFKKIKLIAVSSYVKTEAQPFFKKKIRVINHGVPVKKFDSSIKFVEKKKLKIVTISALEQWKGIQDIIIAISSKRLRKIFEFDIYGDGSYKKFLIDLIYEFNLSSNVSLKGITNKVEKLLPNYDIYCQMSKGEAFGLSLFEAMACGLPTMVYDIPPFDNLIPNEVTKKVKNGSEKDLEKALLSYMNYKERELRGNAGKKFILNNYNMEKMSLEYCSLFDGF